MSNNTYTPPQVWSWDTESGGKFQSINRPISGSTHEKVLPRGDNPFQLYSLATPNGVKVTIMFEELLAMAINGAEYDAYTIDISAGEQFSSGFVELNPNSKIPTMLDCTTNPTTRVFESGAILLYLAEKFKAFYPSDLSARAECNSWLMWQMGSAPFLGGGFGHFFDYAPEKYEYPINRYAMEVKRQLDVLDKHLASRHFLCGDDYSIADMAVFPWYGLLVIGDLYSAQEFLAVSSYKNIIRWATEIDNRPAVSRGKRVNRAWGDEQTQVLERHSAADFK